MSIAETRLTYIALGGNVGDRRAALDSALRHIDTLGGTRVVRCSPFYETAPWGLTAQPDFLNAVAEVETTLDAEALFHALKDIERVMGRVEGPRYGPRLIDLDLLLHGDSVISTPELTVPHPGMPARRFVLVPLNDLAPALRHPVTGHTVAALLASCPDTGLVRLHEEHIERRTT